MIDMNLTTPLMPVASGVACVAGTTHRADPAQSQDAADLAMTPEGHHAVIVSDGIGSFACAGEAALYLVGEARRLLGKSADIWECSYSLFMELWHRLADEARDREETLPAGERVPEENRGRSYGATLLVAKETADEIQIAYAGNGGVFHIRGDFAGWGERLPLPWSATNYLNPHTVLDGGREALYRYLGAFAPQERAEPTILSFHKDARVGDIILVCTDGIYSADQSRCGDPGDGSLWAEVPIPLTRVLNALRGVFNSGMPLDGRVLQSALDAVLADLRGKHLIDDDATAGVLVTGAAVSYQHSLAHEHSLVRHKPSCRPSDAEISDAENEEIPHGVSD